MTLTDFKNIHPNERAFIVGKGPSLDTVETIRENLVGGILFCLNESVHKIESLKLDTPTYCVQQDSDLEYDCIPTNKLTIHFMNSWQHQPGKSKGFKSHVPVSPFDPNAVLYRPDFFKGESESSLSAIIALKIASFMGIKKVTFCCFDALLNGYNGPNTYANCIGKQREGSHRSHDAVIMIEAHKIMTSIKTLKPSVAFCETRV